MSEVQLMASCFFLIFAFIGTDITQSATKPCTHDTLCQCTQHEACQLECIGQAKCQGSESSDTILSCAPGYPCTITCQGAKACRYSKINANGATSLTLQCDGHQSCQHTVVDCNSTNHCTIICSSSSTCEAMDLDCATSICNLHCETQNTCESISINTNDATSFGCSNNCPDTPTSFIRATETPTSFTDTDTTVFSTKSVSKISSIPLTSATATVDDPMLIAIQMKEKEQKTVMETTYTTDIDSNDDSNSIHIEYNDAGYDDIGIYAAIGGTVFCCLLIGLKYMNQYRKNRSQDELERKAHVLKCDTVHRAIPSCTVTTTPVSQSVSSLVAITPVTMTPATYEKVGNLSVIKDDTQYRNSFDDTVNGSFSVYLDIVGDIVGDIASTPGQVEVDLVDDMEMDVTIEINPMKEGANTLVNDDDILDVANGAVNEMEIRDDGSGDVDVDQIVITDFGGNNDTDHETSVIDDNGDMDEMQSTDFIGEVNDDSDYSDDMDNFETIQ